MQKSKLFIIITLLGGLLLSGYQCSSTELQTAKLDIRNGEFDKAIEVLNKEVQNNPKSDEGWFLLGHCYAEMGDFDNMLASFDKSLAISNKFSEDINNRKLGAWADNFNKGVILFRQGNDTEIEDSVKIYYNNSLNAFETAAKIQPDSADTYKNMAFVYMRSGRSEDAIEPLLKLVELSQELDGYRYLGEIYYTLGSKKESSFKNDGKIQDSLDAAANYASAIDILVEGRKLYPEDDEITRILNASYVGAGRIDEALESSELLVVKDPENEVYRYNYGVLLLQTENYEKAEEQLKYALKIKSDYENAIYNLAVTYVRWGTQLGKEEEESENYTGEYKKKYEEAMPYLKSVVEMDPENAQIWELLGKVYSILGMQDEALDAYDHADQLR